MSVHAASSSDIDYPGDRAAEGLDLFAAPAPPAPALAAEVPIRSLRPADSPRLTGEDPAHVLALAETDEPLPPILVHAGTMRVIDGMHRLRAAELRGCATIGVRYFHGAENLVFALAVKLNVAHGLPLSVEDRKAAAGRILAGHPDWSDRAVAALSGLSARTVAGLRTPSPQPAAGSGGRLGRDGRRRPVDARLGRQIASEIIAARPEASLREVAKVAGISPMTVRDVRERMLRGADPLPDGLRSGCRDHADDGPGRDGASAAGARHPRTSPAAILVRLRRDPAIRLSQHGRELLRWLEERTLGPAGWEARVSAIPDHSAFVMAELAKTCANEWLEFAQYLEQRTRRSSRSGT